MLLIGLLAVVFLCVMGSVLLEDLGDVERWARREARKRMRDAAAVDRSAF